jgi:hypothetical protein
MINERKLTKSELDKREDIIQALKKNKRNFVKKYGKDAEKVMYGVSTKQAKKSIQEMNKLRLKNMIEAALKNPEKADLNKDGKLSSYEKKRGAAVEKNMKENLSLDEKAKIYWMQKLKRREIDELPKNPKEAFLIQMMKDQTKHDEETLMRERGLEEDLDIGHQDNEPHMLKADLYRIGKYAMELYQMVGKFEYGHGEVDFPHWWQAKIIKAKEMLVSAKHYLDFETKEPEIDAMVGIIDKSGALDNVGVEKELSETSQPTEKTPKEKEEYDIFLRQKMEKLIKKIKDDPKLLNVFKRLKDK